MTMFSAKPKFDLAEFLAQPAPTGSRVRRSNFRRFAPRKETTSVADDASGDADTKE